MGCLSLESIKRQVDREGKPWGIFGVIKDGKVFAASSGRGSSSVGGIGIVEESTVLICEVNEDAPFVGVLAFRIQRGEWDAMKRFRESAERRKKAMEAQYEATAEPFRDRARWLLNRPLRVPVVR